MDRKRIPYINELALTFRAKQLPREHLARWLRSVAGFSTEELQASCQLLVRRERMPSLADALADLRWAKRASAPPPSRKGCGSCHGGYRSSVDDRGYRFSVRCPCVATALPQGV